MAAGPKGRRPKRPKEANATDKAAPVGEAPNVDRIDIAPILDAAKDLAEALEAVAVGPPTTEVFALCLVQAGSLLVRIERALPGYVSWPPGFNCGGSMRRMTVLGTFVSCVRWTYDAWGLDANGEGESRLTEPDRNRFRELAGWLRAAIAQEAPNVATPLLVRVERALPGYLSWPAPITGGSPASTEPAASAKAPEGKPRKRKGGRPSDPERDEECWRRWRVDGETPAAIGRSLDPPIKHRAVREAAARHEARNSAAINPVKRPK